MGTDHCRAAADSSSCRAVAPARRSGSQAFSTDSLPPDPWLSSRMSQPHCSTRARSQGTSSSSAISIGSAVFTPCPMSGFFAHSVTAPSGVMRISGWGSKAAVVPVCASAAKPSVSAPLPAATRRRKPRRSSASAAAVMSAPLAR